MPLYLPDSTVSTTWTTFGDSSAHLCVDEDCDDPDDDTTFVTASAGEVCTLGLPTSIVHPNRKDGHRIRVYHRLRNYAGSPTTLQVELLQDTSVLATFTRDATTDALYSIGEFNLSESEAASITNYALLRIRLTDNASPGSSQHRVSAVDFFVPDRRRRIYVIS